MSDDIAARLAAVHARIERAARAAGRDPSSVRLLAVSKTKPEAAIRAAYAAGQRDFGENYVQELAEKAAALTDLPDLRWHMIGHLQRNKAKQVVKLVSAIHTVDSVRLAEELGKRAAEAARDRLSVLVEVNVGGEVQKSGCAPAELGSVIAAIERAPALGLSGLMTVPPHTDDPAGARPFFDRLVALRDAHGGVARLPELSMGMTHDLEQAIGAGATWVRIGTAIFGERA
ncbi:MAG: YggS family pyridoxal phosphate-dependent enzyme [Polyangiaceae bacterium]|nr:YggS family pyridoxal phosphate-dependent enzyme [Polyangiaceae bacterium]MCE7892378.1 YggS family pyridoxal phosphate-dependent enzyme [Sorangiineae bacterium PRO1]MCL4752954.1 YggS family pyridoxal phosphate-dependent enzyme [Myxococcales bacterium]